MIVIGGDPGDDGGAVGTVDGVIRYAVVWKRYGTKRPPRYTVTDSTHGGSGHFLEPFTMAEIGDLLVSWCATLPGVTGGPLDMYPPITVAVEGLYVDMRWPDRSMALATSAGKLIGPLDDVANERIMRPKAAVWRPAILGIPGNSSSKAAEAMALRVLNTAKRPFVEGWRELTPAMRENPHLAEAVCIARFAHVTKEREQLAKNREPPKRRSPR